ncbi:sensor histidine kinase, partial [Nonomuraea sp. NN258]|uniref:sensor histidine kinase n=1 Tax=Nonomuraea antri TaxID=2730852 RepID=UPI001568D7D6
MWELGVTWSALALALVVACGCCCWLGAALARARRRHRTALEERGWLLERERERAARQAVDAERARIAGELHDIVSHNVSLMVVQAGAAREVLTTLPGEAEAALKAVETAGRDAMTELRHLLGLLAPSQSGDDSPGDSHGSPGSHGSFGDSRGGGDARDGDLAPQPSLSRLSPLIDRIAFAGLPVEVRISGEPRPLPPGIDVTAYRIVQEALTNALKHGDGSPAQVTVRYADRYLRVEVLNGGPSVLNSGPSGPNGGPSVPDGGPARSPSGDAAGVPG